MSPLKPLTLHIQHTWDGAPLGPDEAAVAHVTCAAGWVEFEVSAPYHGDPPPSAPSGLMDGLWAFEVVEVFLCGPGERYLEVEFGPHGHYLALALEGIRGRASRELLPLEYEATVDGARWQGRARLMLPAGGLGFLPGGVARVNAFAIHGAGAARRYLAAWPTGGARPDFHRLEAFASLAEAG